MSSSVHPQQPEEGREDREETQGANGEAAKGPCRHHCYKKTFLPQCFQSWLLLGQLQSLRVTNTRHLMGRGGKGGNSSRFLSRVQAFGSSDNPHSC